MKTQFALVFLLASTLTAFSAHADDTALVTDEHGEVEFNPFDPKADATLKAMDRQYEESTGLKATAPQEIIPNSVQPNEDVPLEVTPNDTYEEDVDVFSQRAISSFMNVQGLGCVRASCPVYIHVSKTKQRLALYINGELTNGPGLWRTSTGRAGFATPNFDTHPNGRVYQIYSSSKYPGYNNMPFAIFISGGFAIHGAPGSEDAQLGRTASHGCVRIRTSNAEKLNRLVVRNGVANTWITVAN